MITRALFAYDGSPLSLAILPHLRGMGEPGLAVLRAVPSGAEPAERIAAQLDVGRIAASLREMNIGPVREIVREGDAAEWIVAAAAEFNAGVIGLTTHGRTGYDRLVLGSVAERVIRSSPIPVLALRSDAPAAIDAKPAATFERVVVGYDGSEHAWRAVETLALLGAAGRGKVHLLGVADARAADEPEPHEAYPDRIAREKATRRLGALRDVVERGAQRARDLGLDATAEASPGIPVPHILDRAEELGATLIALGTHGRSGLARLALGSVAEGVLRLSHIPLLIRR